MPYGCRVEIGGGVVGTRYKQNVRIEALPAGLAG